MKMRMKRILWLAVAGWACLGVRLEAQQVSGLLRDVFLNIPGSSVEDLINDPSFPDRPSSTDVIGDFLEVQDQFDPFTGSFINYFGQRLTGYILPPTTGSYTFWIASDDASALYLSTDDSPSHKVEIAHASSWTNFRDWTSEPSQTSDSINLQAGRRYYIEVLMKQDTSDNHVSVRWQLPSGVLEEPIPASRLLPSYIPTTPPIITQQPTNTVAPEGGTAIFRVRLANADRVFFQWYRGDIEIPGAVYASYTNASARVLENGARFSCLMTNLLGSTNSTAAVLTVIPDLTPPTIVSVVNVGVSNLLVTYSEPVADADRPSYYALDRGIYIRGATNVTDSRTVLLNTTLLGVRTSYTLTVSGVYDLAANANTIAPDTRFAFTTSELASQTVGPLPAPPIFLPVGGGYRMTVTGGDIGARADQFQFNAQQRLGDFDFKLRVQSLIAADPWAKAGLMARDGFKTNAAFAAAFATPGISGCYFQSRATNNGTAASQGSIPVNYPYTWLRLQRAGDVFSGFASFDGEAWMALGSATVVMTNTVYLGVAVSAHGTNQLVVAEVRDFGGMTTEPTLTHLPADFESLGPSSRRTPIAISEIMFHPLPGADGKDLEYVELFNSGSTPYSLETFRLRGDIQYDFPAGTVMAPGSFLVVAHAPADLQSRYRLTNVLGGYQGRLSNRAGTLQLQNHVGAVFLDIPYSGAAPWPVAADGAGHSLVLARPSLGEGNPAAWAASARVGGSPGAPEIYLGTSQQAVTINELLASSVPPAVDFLELYNHSTNRVDLSGCGLSDDPATHKFVFPVGSVILGRGFISLTRDQLGFGLSSAGETVYFTSPQRDQVIDAVRFGPSAAGLSQGRYPDGASTWRPLSAPTPGGANAEPYSSPVVINEIMYQPISDNADDTYVELFNKGTNTVDLSGWKFVDGISYTFPANTALAAGGYLVVAKNAARLQTHYTNLSSTNLVGDFGGNLSGSGERLALAMPVPLYTTNADQSIQITYADAVIEEVRYANGGRWGQWANGGGSSLELIDPRADNILAANWADSVETNKSVWVNVEHTGILDWGTNVYGINSLDILLLDAGECLVDDLEVMGPGGVNMVINPSFEFGTNNWSMRGTHQRSHLEDGLGYGGSRSLHVVATGRGDTASNQAHGDLLDGLVPGDQVTIRAKVRWLKGTPEILLRLRGNYLEAPGLLAVPSNLGTPGLRNSRWARNVGPAIFEVAHTPVLPAANEPVLVTARVRDPDGLRTVSLRYRLDPDSNLITVAMTDDGKNGDEVADDGVYSALIPGQPAGILVAFSLQASDKASPALSALFPSDAPARECLVLFGDTEMAGGFATYHMWFTDKTRTEWENREQGSDDPLDATFVYGNERAIYNVGAYYHGSPWHWTGYDSPLGGNCGYNVSMPADDQFLGTSDLVLMPPGNFGSDSAAQREQVYYWMEQQLGLITAHRRFCHMYVNGTRRSYIFEDAQKPAAEFINQWFPHDSSGDLHKVEEWFEFSDPVNRHINGFQMKDATLEKFTTAGGVNKVARYRWCWMKRAVHGSANDYSSLMELVDALNAPGTNFTSQTAAALDRLVDVEEWMRIIASRHVAGDWDSIGYRKGKNMFIYKPVNGRWLMMNWDMSFVFGNGDGPNSDVFDVRNYHDSRVIEPITQKMFQTPVYRRAYLRALQDMANGPLRDDVIGPVLDANYAALIGNGATLSASSGRPNSIKTFVTGRRAYIQKVLATNSAPFSLTSNGGADFGTNRSLIALEGTAPIAVSNITINGVSYPVQWTSVTRWSIKLPLQPGANGLLVQGFDNRGNLVTNTTDQISITYNGATERPEDRIVINEIMYHPETPDAAYVELFNTSTTQAFDLSRWRLHGVDFIFSDGTILAPQSFLVVAKNRTVFADTYGEDLPVVGDYAGQLSNGGETLSLVQPGATPDLDTTITEVTYDNVAPWPAAADGAGASLQLIDPLQGDNRVANWTAVGTNGYAPGRWQYRSVTGTATGSRLSLSLSGPGEALIDDLSLVAGYSPSGQNLALNGDFEAPLAGAWTADASYAGSRLESQTVHGGNGALRLVSTGAGANEALHQVIAPALVSGQFYTLSYWYWMSPTSPQLMVQPEGAGFARPDALARYTPGKPNSVKGSLGKLPSLWINEVQAENVGAAATAAGDKAPWIELYNGGADALDLGGFYLADSATNLTQAALPGGLVLQPKQFLLIWADGKPELSTATERHLAFRLAPGSGSVLLARFQGGNATVVDYLRYSGLNPGTSIGGYPDATSPKRQVFYQPTPGMSNQGGVAPLMVRINEWMADNQRTLADPADGKFQDWFELYNGGATPVDLAGFTLTDNATNTAKYVIPAGQTIPPRGFLLVWADGEPKQNSFTNQLHTSFKLAKASGYLGLYTPQGALVDAVNYGLQIQDVSQGRSPDGGPEPYVSFPAPTPGSANSGATSQVRIVELTAENGQITIVFLGKPGASYQLRYKNQLQDGAWTNLGAPVLLQTTQGSVVDTAPGAAQRFYQIIAGPGL